ncbi:MAG: SBBP repeat-containing protein [Nitrospira sp.]|nr:SBBP repeat-containing protein [Nitrospira sp.]
MKTMKLVMPWVSRCMLTIVVNVIPVAPLWADTMEGTATSPPSIPTVQASYGKLPLQFEANQGQWEEQVRFLARGPGYRLFLTPSESVLVLQQREPTRGPAQRKRGEPTVRPEPPTSRQAVVRMTLEGANPTPALDGTEPLPGIVNYFIGNDPAKWRTNIPTYAKVQYQEVYPGIDLAYYGNQGTVEYDFIVAPGADPDQIKLAFEGASDIQVADSGDLLLATALGEVRVQKPLVYQLDPEGHKTLVAGHYLVEQKAAHLRSSSNPSVLSTRYSALPHIGIQLAAYDRTKPLVIDPVLLYSTYLGGNPYKYKYSDGGTGIAVDGSGQAYVTGVTFSEDFPTLNATQPALGGAEAPDAFVTKLTATGALLYSTYLGGSGDDAGRGIAVDGSGQASVTGGTDSWDFPTLQASQPAPGGNGDAFVSKFTATGALASSTYLGGSGYDEGAGIAVDGSGQVSVTGGTFSGDFPTLQASQPASGGNGDAFVTKFSASGALASSTYLGGSGYDEGAGIAVDGSAQAYVTGITQSRDFPTLQASQPASGGGNSDAFVTKFSASGALAYSTYLSGSGDEFGNGDAGHGIAVDGSGQASVTGVTSSVDFPTLNASQPIFGGISDAFVTKFTARGALASSTYLGGSGGDGGAGIAVDGSGQASVTGVTSSVDFPTLQASQPALRGTGNAFVTKLSASGTNQPPVCSSAQANPAVLWAPNHQLVPIAIVGVTDPEGDAVTITATGVTQDEPVASTGSGKASPDAVIQAGAVSVRAERAGHSNGRVYHIAFTADDGQGNSCSGAVTVGVPHSLHKGTTAIDDGQLYDSTIVGSDRHHRHHGGDRSGGRFGDDHRDRRDSGRTGHEHGRRPHEP